MNLDEYSKLAMRTAKEYPNPMVMMDHGALGLGSEVGELAITLAPLMLDISSMNAEMMVNIQEELGDQCWFIAYTVESVWREAHPEWRMPSSLEQALKGRKAFDYSDRRSAANERSPHTERLVIIAFTDMCAAMGESLTLIKAHVYYGKALDHRRLAASLTLQFDAIERMAHFLYLDIDKILQGNIDKLAKRYPDRYTDAAAIARADKE